jgi:hypothetical protein
MSYTPGPWKKGSWSGRCLKTHEGQRYHPGHRGNDPCVYTPHFYAGGDGIASDSGEEIISISEDRIYMSDDNATLISAAPDLLEALQALTSECELAGHGSDKDYDWPKCMKDARSAILKALGK